MQLTYDPACNIAYIRLKKKTAKVRTVVVSDELNVDLAPDGSIYGIELLNANKQLGGNNRRIVLHDKATGKSAELRLAV
jgi:uncharacterized protein YuzE